MPENTPETRPAGAVKTLVIEDVEFSFRWAPPGKFTMGSPETEVMRVDHETLHEVTFESGFWILATPVTQRQFMLTKKRNPAAFCSTGARRRYIVDRNLSLPRRRPRYERLPNRKRLLVRRGEVLPQNDAKTSKS